MFAYNMSSVFYDITVDEQTWHILKYWNPDTLRFPDKIVSYFRYDIKYNSKEKEIK